jgi:hypothetical protein
VRPGGTLAGMSDVVQREMTADEQRHRGWPARIGITALFRETSGADGASRVYAAPLSTSADDANAWIDLGLTAAECD